MNDQTRHSYTLKEIRFLEKNVTGRSYAELTKLFNKRFSLTLSESKVKDTCKYRRLFNGKKSAPNRPIGSERVESDGYVVVKVAHPNIWRHKHLAVWEAVNGMIPKGYVVIFADRDKTNFKLKNLLLVSRRELCLMNRYGFISCNNNLTKTGKAIADLTMAINDRKRGTKNRKSQTKSRMKTGGNNEKSKNL
jgi:hypothetical protein